MSFRLLHRVIPVTGCVDSTCPNSLQLTQARLEADLCSVRPNFWLQPLSSASGSRSNTYGSNVRKNCHPLTSSMQCAGYCCTLEKNWPACEDQISSDVSSRKSVATTAGYEF
jgi:hypothetical protein